MTSLEEIYNIFLHKVEDDDWDDPNNLEDYKVHWHEYLNAAIGYFKFPRVSLELNEEGTDFISTLSNAEKQILADYMKVEWLQGTINTWEKIKTDYSEADFSQANLLKQLDTTFKTAIERAERREKNYYRSIDGKVFPYRDLAGDNYE